MKSWSEYITALPLEEQFIPAMKTDFDRVQLKKIGNCMSNNGLSVQKAVFKELPENRWQWNAESGWFDRLANGVRGLCIAKVRWTRLGGTDGEPAEDFAVLRINTKKDVELLGAGRYDLVKKLMADAPARVIMKNFDVEKIYWIPAEAKAEAAISDEEKEARREATATFKDPLLVKHSNNIRDMFKKRAEEKKEGKGETIYMTPFYSKAAFEVLQSVLGQLSDGWGENSGAYNKWWEFAQVEAGPSGRVQIRILNARDNFDPKSSWRYRSWTRNAWLDKGMSEKEIFAWFAAKIKKTVKMELDDFSGHSSRDWDRANTKFTSDYLSYGAKVSIAQIYCIYDMLMGRKVEGKYPPEIVKSVIGR